MSASTDRFDTGYKQPQAERCGTGSYNENENSIYSREETMRHSQERKLLVYNI